MSTSPLISAVIPAYNHEKYVEHCLDSVLNDPYPNKEIIVIDDGSTDKTYERIQAWANKNGQRIPIIIRSHPNKGTSATLNEAISLATGQFIAPIASDDYFLPGGFTKRVEYLEARPQLMAAIGDCITVDGNGAQTHESTLRDFHHTDLRHYETPAKVAFRIVWRWALPGPVLFARRELWNLVGGYNEQRKVEDWDFFLRLAAHKTLGFVDIKVGAYRWHQSNTCATPARQAFVQNELAATAFQRMFLFRNPLLFAIVFAKGCLYKARAWRSYFLNNRSLSK